MRLNLPEARLKSGVTLQAISDRTKITSGYLRAIEAEDFDALPGCIYSISYIRQYAEAIHYDANLILAVFREKTVAH